MSVEVLLVASHVSCLWQLHMGFGFLKPIPLHSDSVYIFLLSDLFLLPSPAYLLFMSEFSQEFLVHLFSSPDTFAWFAHQDAHQVHSCTWRWWSLRKKQLTWTLPPFRPSPMAFFQVAPWSGEVCSFYYCSAIYCVSLSQDTVPQHCMVTAAKMSAFPSDFSSFVSIKSSRAPLLTGFLIICVRMLSMHSRNLLDFLCPLCCPSREIFEVLHDGQRLWKWSFFLLSNKDFIQFFLIRGL